MICQLIHICQPRKYVCMMWSARPMWANLHLVLCALNQNINIACAHNINIVVHMSAHLGRCIGLFNIFQSRGQGKETLQHICPNKIGSAEFNIMYTNKNILGRGNAGQPMCVRGPSHTYTCQWPDLSLHWSNLSIIPFAKKANTWWNSICWFFCFFAFLLFIKGKPQGYCTHGHR